MTVQPLTLPAVTSAPAEPTHRFGRALDDRLPFASSLAARQTGAVPQAEATQEIADISFDDVLDIINPLQHLPIVSTIYREITGDEIGPAAKVVGGGLFGGIVGAAASLVDVAIEQFSGDDAGGHIMTALFGDDPTPNERSIATAPANDTPQDAVTLAEAQTLVAPLPVLGRAPGPSLESTPAPAPQPTKLDTTRTQDSAPVPNMSADAFDMLMQSFGPAARDDSADGDGHIAVSPDLAYATPARAGQVLDTAL